jgi:hypothetical protein
VPKQSCATQFPSRFADQPRPAVEMIGIPVAALDAGEVVLQPVPPAGQTATLLGNLQMGLARGRPKTMAAAAGNPGVVPGGTTFDPKPSTSPDLARYHSCHAFRSSPWTRRSASGTLSVSDSSVE